MKKDRHVLLKSSILFGRKLMKKYKEGMFVVVIL